MKNDELRALLTRTLPMLERLGDFIGNGPTDAERPGSLGTRCDLIGDIKSAIKACDECKSPVEGHGLGCEKGKIL